MALKLADLQLDNAVVEIRFPPAFMLWDTSGKLWSTCRSRWPELTPVHAEPSKTIFRLRNYELSAEWEAARLVGRDLAPGDHSIEQLCRDSKTFLLDFVCETLEVTTLLRVGFRVIYQKQYRNIETASAAVMDLGLVRGPRGQAFKGDGIIRVPEYGVRIDAPALSTTVRVRVETRQLKFEPPPGIPQLTRLDEELIFVVVDADIATSVPSTVSQISLDDWLSQARHLINRDLPKFLGE